MLVGLALYTAASLAGAARHGSASLVAWRAVQGAAMAAAVICARSIVRDLHEAQPGAGVMSKALTGLGVLAVLSPIVGGVVVEAFGWHATLLTLVVFSAVTPACALRFKEAVPRREASATRPAAVLRDWIEVCSDPTFRAWALRTGRTFGGLFAMLAGSSFVFLGILGVGHFEYGVILGSGSLVDIGGTFFWCRLLLRRHGLRGAVSRGAAFSLAGGAGAALLGLAGVHTVWAILVRQGFHAIGHGVHQPCAQTGAVGPFPEKAGTAAPISALP